MANGCRGAGFRGCDRRCWLVRGCRDLVAWICDHTQTDTLFFVDAPLMVTNRSGHPRARSRLINDMAGGMSRRTRPTSTVPSRWGSPAKGTRRVGFSLRRQDGSPTTGGPRRQRVLPLHGDRRLPTFRPRRAAAVQAVSWRACELGNPAQITGLEQKASQCRHPHNQMTRNPLGIGTFEVLEDTAVASSHEEMTSTQTPEPGEVLRQALARNHPGAGCSGFDRSRQERFTDAEI